MKATSIFGGVQIITILISVIRSKFIAVLLGPVGMGIVGLLTATTGIVGKLTNFGLGTSAVKNISVANVTNDTNRVAIVIAVLRRLVWITGFLGSLITLILAPWLSQLTFGNNSYTVPFIWISCTLLFTQLTTGQLVVLQGLRKLQYLAKANMIGSLFGLVVSVPIYYVCGINGIVPAIIVSSILALAISTYFSSKLKLDKVRLNKTLIKTEGKDMLHMGFLLSLSGLMTVGAAYVVRIYIGNQGGIAEVGLYNAGFAIINTYVGMVFTAMGTDYYPRLSAVADDNTKSGKEINHQAEIAVLILAPMLTVFLIFINWIVVLLYSNKFVEISGMIHWAALGIFFKAATWSIGFILLAKGASKIFFYSELASNSYLLLFNIIGYKYLGLEGIGISFLLSYIISFFQVYFIAKARYEFVIEKVFYKIFSILLIIAILCFITVKTISDPFTYIIGTILILIATIYSLRELDKRIGLKSAFQTIRNKISNKGS